ncbi:cell growth-regulating nucleolar protein isoform X2 [Pseudophryne corroboree]|uniref:cell growth-regulating nucleolar protein isoform X2 n=1 Tax=Pseudophryne corroboree TaxID=495146 RepID=UPI0030817E70
MVFFTCNACGESLKKGQVDKHTAMCRNCKCLSCIDCGKDFWGEEYKTHLKCISEEQKYGGKGFEGKAKKGDVKQQQWIERIYEAMNKPNISSNLKNILNQLSTFDNIPRKKTKFQNWMQNSLKIHSQTMQDQVWEIFSDATSTQNKAASSDTPKLSDAIEITSEASGTAEVTEKKKSKRERKEERQTKNKKEKKDLSSEGQAENGVEKKSKKRVVEEESMGGGDCKGRHEESMGKKKKKRGNENIDEEQIPQKKKKKKHEEFEGKFNWKGTIKALLRQAPDHELPIKRLRKKVISQYYATSSETHKSEKELLSTFNKKIKNNPKFRVLKENVKLIK